MQMFRIGIIGCGQIAQIAHIPFVTNHPGLELAALCDSSESIVRACGRKYRIDTCHCHTDYNSMLESESLDLVAICTPDHYLPSLAASNKGVHQLIEKPLAFDPEQAEDMIRCADQNRVWILIGYMKCYDPNFLTFKSLVQSIAAEIKYIRVHNFGGAMDMTTQVFDIVQQDSSEQTQSITPYASSDNILRQPVAGNQHHEVFLGMMMGLSHDVSLLRKLIGEPCKIISAVTQNGVTIATLKYDRYYCCLEYAFLYDRPIWDEFIEVYSDKKTIRIDFPWPYLMNSPSKITVNENEEGGSKNVSKSIVSSFDEAYRREWQHAYDCLAGKATPYSTAIDAKADILLFQNIIQALK